MDYTIYAKKCAQHGLRVNGPNVALSEFYVVWFSKTLKNWKALVSTDVISGIVIEVTYNGEKSEAYVDIYKKHHNVVITNDNFNN